MNIERLQEIVEEVKLLPDDAGEERLDGFAQVELYFRFMYAVIKEMKPKLAIECGTGWWGRSPAYMASATPETFIITIDHVPLNENVYKALKEKFEKLRVLTADTCEEWIYESIRRQYPNGVGFLFLDSEHDGVTPLREYNFYRLNFADECVVCVDDIYINDQMRSFWENFPGEKFSSTDLHRTGFGVSLIRK